MKISLINPPLSLDKMYGALSKAGNTMPALGICYLAAIAREHGHDVQIVDAVSRQIDVDQLVSEVTEYGPDIIGFSATTIAINTAAFSANKLVEKMGENITIILGGPHITAIPLETLNKYEVFDIGVIGEGEDILVDILNNKELDEIDGIIFRQDGKLIRTKPREKIKSLDSLPIPAFDLLPDFPAAYRPAAHSFMKLPAATLVTSRGCPYSCTFCDRSVFGNKFRAHSAKYVFSMIRKLYFEYGVREIVFYDDTFMISKNRVCDLCQLLIDSKMRISWSCFGRVDCVDPKLLKLMRQAGCWQIGYGIESGDQKILAIMKKTRV